MSTGSCSSCFTTLVVTSPDTVSSKATAECGPMERLKRASSMKILSTCDPFNSRCGSGGGTLAALDQTAMDETVLIIHAGGESSRCPTQMVLGKAWTSLATKYGIISDPTTLMVHQLTALLTDLPLGSVVVAASDTLLSFSTHTLSIDWNNCQYNDSVIGLAVPAPLETATNHGVYCLNTAATSTSDKFLMDVHQFLQKPTIDEMHEAPHCVFKDGHEESAWIDTGVVIFLPKAAAALRTLCDHSLACCTERGLTSLYAAAAATTTTSDEQLPDQLGSLEEFAQTNALRVELYTHFLLALSTTKGRHSISDFLSSHNDLSADVLRAIHDALSPFKIVAIAIPDGQFLHLGTSREMLDFMVDRTSPSYSSIQKKQCHDFAQNIGMVKRLKSFCVPSRHVATSTVMVNCVVSTSGPCVIREHSFVEHCALTVGTIDIGMGCILSGIRGTATKLIVPDNMCFQMIPLSRSSSDGGGHIYMYLGLTDDIKSGTNFYGIELSDLLTWTGLREHDLWADTEMKKVLWTAKLHPVVSQSTTDGSHGNNNPYSAQLQHEQYFAWITELLSFSHGSGYSLSINGQTSLKCWQASKRLPLNKIRNYADAEHEWSYRRHLEDVQFLEATIDNFNRIKVNLLKRCNVETDMDFIIDHVVCTKDNAGMTRILQLINEVVDIAMATNDYDIASRALMVASAVLENIAVAFCPYVDEMEMEHIDFDFHALSSPTVSTDERKAACLKVISLCQEHLAGSSIETEHKASRVCSVAMEKAASALTALYICGTISFTPFGPNKALPILDKWVIATAPARIDLSGGWSDTPPICYEYGGAVCGVAVSIDGFNPVSCRCRIVKGGKGVLLRTESRNHFDGKLESKTETSLSTISDISDFRDPCAQAALIKCALVYFRIAPMDAIHSGATDNLQPFINAFCGVRENVGLEIISTSLLPCGSGMGTSSILGGCILTAIAKCLGIDCGRHDDDHLTHMVLMLEQLLTTGGGWQDQIGGLVGGFKLGTSKANAFPLSTNVERIQVSKATISGLNDRLVLLFTGQTRLAKNILQSVLRRWARRTEEIVSTVEGLVNEAKRVAKALEEGNIDVVADCLTKYWSQKKIMAGPDSGVEPPFVRRLLLTLTEKDIISGGSLCGAGGGGFMVMLIKDGRTKEDLRTAVLEGFDPDGMLDCSWHDCSISLSGLDVTTLDDLTGPSSKDCFDIDWHRV